MVNNNHIVSDLSYPPKYYTIESIFIVVILLCSRA